jgi:hypothetical protein
MNIKIILYFIIQEPVLVHYVFPILSMYLNNILIFQWLASIAYFKMKNFIAQIKV